MYDLFDGAASASIDELVDRFVKRLEASVGEPVPDDKLDYVRNIAYLAVVNFERAERGETPLRTAVHHSDDQIQAGRAALPHFLQRARKAEGKATLKLKRMLDGVRAAEIEAVIVYESPAGAPRGWQADIMFSRAIGGFGGDIIGTTGDRPCATRKEAEEQIVDALACVLACIDGVDA
ncbi:hypothetical protein [Falsiroseomonas sp. HW251]|uniref:hypothetical protein n=1 Tax=Falsiroseomonas sp. HW251 TaxID=3390998 RepID=UPI003D31FA56